MRAHRVKALLRCCAPSPRSTSRASSRKAISGARSRSRAPALPSSPGPLFPSSPASNCSDPHQRKFTSRFTRVVECLCESERNGRWDHPCPKRCALVGGGPVAQCGPRRHALTETCETDNDRLSHLQMFNRPFRCPMSKFALCRLSKPSGCVGRTRCAHGKIPAGEKRLRNA